jgi:hypothetical protein
MPGIFRMSITLDPKPRHVTRRPEDPDQDGVADEHRDAKGDAEDLAESAPAGGRDQPGCPDDVIRAIGGVGQLEVRRGDGL